MESGYKILWTDHALKELADTYKYLQKNFTTRELNKLSTEIERILKLITQNPKIFPESESMGLRRVVIKKFNTLYYRVESNQIQIISFFSNRQNPNKRQT